MPSRGGADALPRRARRLAADGIEERPEISNTERSKIAGEISVADTEVSKDLRHPSDHSRIYGFSP
jgi:hypothetical protein